MLEELQVQNLALTSEAQISFKKGFCCITGETGAGKSILIDALSLVSGSRADVSMVKSGAEKCEIAAIFSLENKDQKVKELISGWDLTGDDDSTLLIRRIVTCEGKSRAWINGHSCTLAALKAVANHLISIHGQHEGVRLVDSDEQLDLLDNFGGLTLQREKLAEAYHAYSSARIELTKLSEEQKAGAAAYKTLRFELESLRSLELKEGSYEELEKAHDKAVHDKEIEDALAAMLDALTNEDGNIIDTLESKTTALLKILPYAGQLKSVVTSLQETAVSLKESRDVLQSFNVAQGGESFETLSEKLGRCHELSRRFEVKPEKLYEKTYDLEEKLGRFLSLKDEIEKLTLKVKSLKDAYEAAELELHNLRVEAARAMSAKVEALIHDLAMKDGRFEVRVAFDEQSRPKKLGRDEAAFYFSANTGEQLRTLSETASGGELSRLALAIETVNSSNNKIPTIIFDEVDSGVSGRTATSVGFLLHQISQNAQVLCVTHLPQVAARADVQYLVSKVPKDGRVSSHINMLDENGRVEELARMMGGNLVSSSTLHSARELLERSQDGFN